MEQTIVGKEQNRKTSEDGRTENAAPIRKEAEQTAGAVRWTPEQRKVIDLRGRSMLVSAAAGSGKTAVLVERIISLVTDSTHPVDVDQLLVVTFTNAAAAEMRERVLNAIEKAVEADPGNVHLQRQMTLIHNAQITTIDSFCSYVLRGYFHKIGLEPGFRIGDPGELTLLREDVCDQVLEEFYAGKDPQFLLFTDSYSAAKSDRPIREMILRMYDFSRSYPWPREWLDGCAAQYQADSVEELEEKPWMREFLSYLHVCAEEEISRYREIYPYTLDDDGPQMYAEAVEDDLCQLQGLLSCRHLKDWQEQLSAIVWKKLKPARKYEGSQEKKDAVANARKRLKNEIDGYRKKYFSEDPVRQMELLQKTATMVRMLVTLVNAFAEKFGAAKAKKNMLDFSDVEHNALDILVDPQTKEPTETAAEFRSRFAEVMIDEYQDSNYVQEALLTAVSGIPEGRQNLFMVGDVKQSIYRFRLARPELFMEKYDGYSTDEGERQRIDLHKNFRSRGEVVETVNDIFYRIMGRDLGKVEYDSGAALYQGAEPAPYEEPDCCRPECLVITDAPQGEDKKTAEARAVAQRIRRLVEDQEIPGKQYRDCVILLRSFSGWSEIFQAVFEQEGIPLIVSSQTGYFSAQEVQTVLAFLRILDNPRQDIPLTAVMRSFIGQFSSEELARIRIENPGLPFYECVRRLAGQAAEVSGAEEPEGDPDPRRKKLAEKTARFRELLHRFRQRVPYTPVHVLIRQIYEETNFRDYVTALPAGAQRRANLDMLLEKAVAYEKTSYHGLFHFVRYIDRLMKYNVDYGEAERMGEQENAVRLMTIHKSKGLEFPVVVVAGMGKAFNTQDMKSSMIFHPEYGVALKWSDPEKRIRKDTLIRQVFSLETKKENLGEELRILYVALTRAKEKLILTGFAKKEAIGGFRPMKEGEKLPFSVRMGAVCCWDWVLPALGSYGDRYSFEICDFGERVKGEQDRQGMLREEKRKLLAELSQTDEKIYRQICASLSWRYPYENEEWFKQKVSVSEIKHRAMEEVRESLGEDPAESLFPPKIPAPYLPKFVQERGENRGALRGTAMHRFLECLDFAAVPLEGIPGERKQYLKAAAERMLREGRMTEEEMELVSFRQMEDFLHTPEAARMVSAAKNGLLSREQPFVMALPACRVWPQTAAEDPVLVQGIIDVFWEEEDGIVVLDYKTDRVKTAEELLARYRAQLLLYGEALERSFDGKKIREILIYSFRLNQMIPVECEDQTEDM